MLSHVAKISAGETLLVTGAAGGLGTAVIQIGKHLGANIIAAVSSESKVEYAIKQGADFAVNYSRTDLKSFVQDVTCGEGVHVAVEHLGGSSFDAAVRCVAPGGRLVTAGGHTGEVVALDVVSVFRNEIKILGSTGQTRADVSRVVDLLAEKLIQPQIYAMMPLVEAAKAQGIVEGREVFGKVVLAPW